MHCRTSRSRADLSVPESDDIASQELAYHTFLDCDLHHHHYGRHVRGHSDDTHYHQQRGRQSSASDDLRQQRSPYDVTMGETQCDMKRGVGTTDGEKRTQLRQAGHQYEAPHNVQLVYCETPSPATLTACRQHAHGLVA